MVTPAVERDAVAHLQTAFGMSERRACQVLGCCRMTMRYQTIRVDDAVLRERMKAIAHERRRFGYRRLHVLLRREGHLINHKRLFRIYREEKLTVRRRGGRKRAMGTRAPMVIAMAPNRRWSLDFVSDQMTDCRRFKVLTVVDDCTRECLALVADTSLSGLRVARELEALIATRGRPAMIVSDNGTGDCQDFRVWGGHNGSKELPICHDVKNPRSPTPFSTSFWPGPMPRPHLIRTVFSTS